MTKKDRISAVYRVIFDFKVSKIRLEAFGRAADGKATKIIIPSEIQGLAGLVSGITEVAAQAKKQAEE